MRRIGVGFLLTVGPCVIISLHIRFIIIITSPRTNNIADTKINNIKTPSNKVKLPINKRTKKIIVGTYVCLEIVLNH